MMCLLDVKPTDYERSILRNSLFEKDIHSSGHYICF